MQKTFFKKIVAMSFFILAFTGMKAPSTKDALSLPPPTITLHYVDRPPYVVTKDDQPTGVVADPAAKIFKKAKIPFVWANTPVNRQFAIVKENKGQDCIVGLEQTTSRLEFGKFTAPLYRGQLLIALVNKSVKEKSGTTLVEMLSKYSILVKENYTQGEYITGLVSKSPKRILTAMDSEHMVQMIAKGHADFMMISNEEVDYYFKHGILNRKEVNVMTLPDVQTRFIRRIMCSKGVDDHVISQLDRAIAKLGAY